MSFPIHGNSLQHVAPCVRGFYYTVSLVPVLYQHGHIQTPSLENSEYRALLPIHISQTVESYERHLFGLSNFEIEDPDLKVVAAVV